MSVALLKMSIFALKALSTLACIVVNFVCVGNASGIGGDGYSGKCGEDLYWSVNSTSRILRINGTGTMADFLDPSNDVPWRLFFPIIETVVIENGVTSLGQYAFYCCDHLSSVSLPLTLTKIGSFAFVYCSSLLSITIPENVEILDGNAFQFTPSLTEVKVDVNNRFFEDIDGVLFNKEGSVLIVHPASMPGSFYEIPSSVKEIGQSAFQTSKFTSVSIPNGVTTISNSAFFYCSALEHVYIPQSVISIGDCPFNACENLSSIDVDVNNPMYGSSDGVLFNKEKTALVQFPLGKNVKSYTIPDTVTTIEALAFYNSELSSVVIPASVTLLKRRAFGRSKTLENVTYLGTNDPYDPRNDPPFVDCDKLHGIYVPLDYDSETLGNLSVCKREPFGETLLVENQCLEVINVSGMNCFGKRPNASNWESRSNGCVAYKCDKDDGFITMSKCRTNNVCVNNECAKGEGKPDKPWSVNITIDQKDDEITLVLNTTAIIEAICEMSGLKSDGLRVEVEMDGDGHILNVIVYVDDEKTAEIIIKAVNNIEEGPSCNYGVLCRRKNAIVHGDIQSISLSLSRAENKTLSMFSMMLMMASIVVILLLEMMA